jgi:predicted translin family RNA/ssDNA-binding protein
MSSSSSLSDIVDRVACQTAENVKIRDSITAIVDKVDLAYRKCARDIAGIHSGHGFQAGLIHGRSQWPPFADLEAALKELQAITANFPFYKYNGLWSHCIQNSIFLVLLIEWLETHKLAPPESVASSLDIPFETPDPTGFHFTCEEYLHGVVSLSNELSRLAITSVTSSKTLEMPSIIDKFLKELQTSMMVLNLKNDSLRRRFDSIKYDVKKVEEVVYDVALKGSSQR